MQRLRRQRGAAGDCHRHDQLLLALQRRARQLRSGALASGRRGAAAGWALGGSFGVGTARARYRHDQPPTLSPLQAAALGQHTLFEPKSAQAPGVSTHTR